MIFQNDKFRVPDVIVPNMPATKSTASKYIKGKLRELKGEIDKYTFIMGASFYFI